MKAVDPNDKDCSEKRINKELREVIKRIIKEFAQKDENIDNALNDEENKLIKLINDGKIFKVSELKSIFDKFTEKGKEAYAKFLKDNHSEESQSLTISRIPNKTGGESVIQTKDITEALEKIKKDGSIKDGQDGTINDKDSLYMSQYISNNTDTGNVPLTKNQVALYKSYCDYNTNNDEFEPISIDDGAKSVMSETVNEVNENKYEYIHNIVNATKVREVPKVQYNSYEYVNSNSNDLNKPIITNYHINDNSDDEKFFRLY